MIHHNEITEIIKELTKNKASNFKDILVKSTVNLIHTFSHALMKIFNNCIKSGTFPDVIRYTVITLVFKKVDTTDKSNYRLISTLFNF